VNGGQYYQPCLNASPETAHLPIYPTLNTIALRPTVQ
jgi:hypothetical protein